MILTRAHVQKVVSRLQTQFFEAGGVYVWRADVEPELRHGERTVQIGLSLLLFWNKASPWYELHGPAHSCIDENPRPLQ